MGKINRTIKRATTSKRYNLFGLFKSSEDKTSIEVINENGIQWWELKHLLLDKFDSVEEASQYIKDNPQNEDLIAFTIEKDADTTPLQICIPGEDHFHEAFKFSEGERVLAVVHAPYYAVLPCIVVGAITKESEKEEEDWEMNDPKDYYSTYEDYVKDWDDWHWDFMEVQPLVKLKSPKWGYTMTDTITVPRIYLFPMATE